ncbi:hypothetical protein [Lewinella sp. LCG006]|uniref:hypothetical protein n=1 Tax=Lewinella sp. LCG006 TaxID=3231911 RepID=UPI00345FA670
MRNALRVIIVFVTTIFFFFACQPAPTESSSLGQASILLEDSNGWALTVQADGSGELLYQRTKLESVNWPSKTFSFKQLRLLPAFAPRIQDTYPYRWTYCSQTENDTRQYGLPDTAWGAAWFEKAYQALETAELTPCTLRKLKKNWATHPPPGVSVQQKIW